MIHARLRAAAGRDRIPTDGLIAHYTMDNVSGSTLVDETGTYDGTITGATASAGKVGDALLFDGVDDYVDIPDAALAFTGSFSIAFWIYSHVSDPGSSGHGVIARDSTSDRGVSIQQHTTPDGIRFGLSPDGSRYCNRDCSSSISVNVWEHYACIYDAGAQTMDIYRNDVLANGSLNNGPIPSSLHVSAVSATLGAFEVLGDSCWDGLIDDVVVYSRAITASERTQIYNRGA